MLVLNYIIEKTIETLKFKEFQPSIIFKEKNEIPQKVFGYIIKFSVIRRAQKIFCYLVFPENLPIFLVNTTKDFEQSLNNKNVVHLIFEKMLNFLKTQTFLKNNSCNFKIENIQLGSININFFCALYSSDFKINNFYDGVYHFIIAKSIYNEISEIFGGAFNFEQQEIDIEKIFSELNNADAQMLLNIFLRNGAALMQLAQIIYCYPQLAKKIALNISKKNQALLMSNLEKLNSEQTDKNIVLNEIKTNIAPIIINVIEKNNIAVYSYLRIKNLSEIYEYYKMKNYFLQYPFERWLEIIIKSENLIEYQKEFLKKEYLLGLAGIDEHIIYKIFSNLSNRAISRIIDDIQSLKKNNADTLSQLKSKMKIIELARKIEVNPETFKKSIIEITALFQQTSDAKALQLLIQNSNQTELFIALKTLKNSGIEEKFVNNFSKNTRKDFNNFNLDNFSKYRIYQSLINIIDLYKKLFECGQLRIKLE